MLGADTLSIHGPSSRVVLPLRHRMGARIGGRLEGLREGWACKARPCLCFDSSAVTGGYSGDHGGSSPPNDPAVSTWPFPQVKSRQSGKFLSLPSAGRELLRGPGDKEGAVRPERFQSARSDPLTRLSDARKGLFVSPSPDRPHGTVRRAALPV